MSDLLAAYERNGRNAAATARELGLADSTVKDRLAKLAREGQAPGHFVSGVAPGYAMGKVTVQRAGDGTVERTWERQSPDALAMQEAMRAAAEAMAEELPRAAPIAAPADVQSQLCNLYTYTDYHMGMLAWHKEGGADWDLGIAERTLAGSFRQMLAQSPAADTAVINIQGDFLHSDGLLPVTPAHKHVLDQDGRFSKIVAAAIRSIRQLIAMALEKHRSIHVIICEGNHDEASSVWLRHMFTALYEDEPRVSVNDSELPFYVFQWGEVMLGFHHGHKIKNEQLPLLFAAQFREAWGQSTKAYIHCGHRHHRDEKEYNGAIVTQHPTLAARDAYAARGGWIAERAAMSITYHKRTGQAGTTFVTPEMLAA